MDIASNRNPWPGLVPYSEVDQTLFFGREHEADRLTQMVRNNPVAVLFGISGSGKTSVVNAAVFPRLRRDGFLPIALRLGTLLQSDDVSSEILGRIKTAFAGEQVEQVSVIRVVEHTTLWEYLHGSEFWDRKNRLITPVLFFDQFEEVFTLGRGLSGTPKFLRDLADLAENYIPEGLGERAESAQTDLASVFKEQRYRILLSLREDFLGQLDELRISMPSALKNRFRLKALSGEQAVHAIRGPAPDLVDGQTAAMIVRFTAASSDTLETSSVAELEVEPSLLSVVCHELNEARLAKAKEAIDASDLGAIGSIIGDFYEHVAGELSDEARSFIEDRLITVSGFRATVALEDAIATGVPRDAIDRLIDRRLIRMEVRAGVPRIELTHDRLTGVVKESRDRRRDLTRVVQQQRPGVVRLVSLSYAAGFASAIALLLLYRWLFA